ncbi:MAG: hypothetical protein IT269_11015, partial [Saprospiraceae bacterium]|nr:hypothetical protein [Saprospiraceae bacterium]
MALLLTAMYSCRKQDVNTTNVAPNTPPDPAQLDQYIQQTILQKGEFLWAWASDEQVWTALSNSDYVLSVGYKPSNEKNIEQRLNQIDLQSSAWRDARKEVLELVLNSERLSNPTLREEELFAFQENGVLPFMELYVRNPATIALLRASSVVRYAEPIGYEPFMTTQSADRSSGGSGCDNNNGNTGLVVNVDYTNITPGCKQSWNHSFHKINQAWANSTGAGVTVMWVDTGASDDQENLGDDFAQGFSGGRNINKLVTLTGPGETPHDQCGHGTAMIGAGAAPRGTDGASAGVAYGCN